MKLWAKFSKYRQNFAYFVNSFHHPYLSQFLKTKFFIEGRKKVARVCLPKSNLMKKKVTLSSIEFEVGRLITHEIVDSRNNFPNCLVIHVTRWL